MDLGLLPILILLPVSTGVVHSPSNWNWFEKYSVPVRCRYLLKDTPVFTRICIGSYPEVAYVKYRDMLIAVEEPVSIYISLILDTVMVLHKVSPLHACHSLEFVNANTFHCLDDKSNRTIALERATMFCFPFHNELPDDLMNECLIENEVDENTHKKQLFQVLIVRRVILHYCFDGAKALRMPKFLLLVLLLQSLYFKIL